MPKRVSVVIPTRNRSPMLTRLLEQIVPMIGDELEQIIVVDNASSDQTSERLAEFPSVTYIRNENNQLSARARQQGWDVASAKYVCFIDDDNLIEEDALAVLADFLDANDNVGVVGPVQRRWSDGSIWCAGGRINRFLVVSYDKQVGDSSDSVEVDFQPNVFMVRNELRNIGVGFDWKRFPHNWSEADFGNKIRAAGYKVATCFEAAVYHDIDYSGYFTRINPTNIFDQAQSRIVYRKTYCNDMITWLIFVFVVLPVSVVALIFTTRTRKDRKRLLALYLKGTLCGILTSSKSFDGRLNAA